MRRLFFVLVVADSWLRVAAQEFDALVVDNSWVRDLTADPTSLDFKPNQRARLVKSGHFVPVRPTPIRDPVLVAASRHVASLVGLADTESSTRFLKAFSGGAEPKFGDSWATPYALSIYGQETVPGGAGADSDGYGDGRAISLAEVIASSTGMRYELQLKGAGRTPFARGGDGRAVLRSSIREFIASEAMHFLRVPTTRALSLIVSGSETVQRPWYRQNVSTAPNQQHGGDHLKTEPIAVVCRVSSSFLRVGHFELFGRRARKGRRPNARHELEQLARHAIFRDYPEAVGATLSDQILSMAGLAAQRMAAMAADWVRVGYAQSNFNSDNCLIAGVTVDFGPFGFIERFKKKWGMWVGSGEHYGFMNQMVAAERNYVQFATSLKPLLDVEDQGKLQAIIEGYSGRSRLALSSMLASKMGFAAASPQTERLWGDLQDLMEDSVDWTIFWRQLSYVVSSSAQSHATYDELMVPKHDAAALLEILMPSFYEEVGERRTAWLRWISRYTEQLGVAGVDCTEASISMRTVSPKFIPREWMLVKAYTKAQDEKDFSILHELMNVFERPYDEQPDYEKKYYRRAPPTAEHQGGTAFMS